MAWAELFPRDLEDPRQFTDQSVPYYEALAGPAWEKISRALKTDASPDIPLLARVTRAFVPLERMYRKDLPIPGSKLTALKKAIIDTPSATTRQAWIRSFRAYCDDSRYIDADRLTNVKISDGETTNESILIRPLKQYLTAASKENAAERYSEQMRVLQPVFKHFSQWPLEAQLVAKQAARSALDANRDEDAPFLSRMAARFEEFSDGVNRLLNFAATKRDKIEAAEEVCAACKAIISLAARLPEGLAPIFAGTAETAGASSRSAMHLVSFYRPERFLKRI